ncbi:hypothetical protein X741_32335 [Mesorhizobium sp. LNHC229A00]|nr:hypothetical protein X741_32335 [Mesorhizobium sp. LNHC229A00]
MPRFTDGDEPGAGVTNSTRSSAGEVLDLFAAAQFDDVTVQRITEPFVVHGGDEESALQLLAEYVVKMYGLEKPEPQADRARASR